MRVRVSIRVFRCFDVSCPNLCPFFYFILFFFQYPRSSVRFVSSPFLVPISSCPLLVSSIAALVSYFSVHPWVCICVRLSGHLRSCVPLSPCPFPCQVFYLNLCSCSRSAAQQLGTVSPLDSPTLLVATLQSWRGRLLQPERLKKSPKKSLNKMNPSLGNRKSEGKLRPSYHQSVR